MEIRYAEYRLQIGVTKPQDTNYRTEITSWREDFVNLVVKAINECGGSFEKGDAAWISITPNQDKIEEIELEE